jgi:hypothetical protein
VSYNFKKFFFIFYREKNSYLIRIWIHFSIRMSNCGSPTPGISFKERQKRKMYFYMADLLYRSGKNMEREVFQNASSHAEYVAGITRLGTQTTHPPPPPHPTIPDPFQIAE